MGDPTGNATVFLSLGIPTIPIRFELAFTVDFSLLVRLSLQLKFTGQGLGSANNNHNGRFCDLLTNQTQPNSHNSPWYFSTIPWLIHF